MTAESVARRGELLAEVFLQDLKPAFLARLELRQLPFDFLAGFKSIDGFLTIVAVEVKAVSRLDPKRFSVFASKQELTFFRASNLPFLLLIVDVKRNRIFYNWGEAFKSHEVDPTPDRGFLVSLTLVDDLGRQRFLDELNAIKLDARG